MANNLLLLGVVGAMGWLFLSGPPPKTVGRTPASEVAAAHSSATAYAGASGSGIASRQDPVPLVRNVRAFQTPPVLPAPDEAPVAVAEQENSDRSVAKAAAELDGYKRVSVIGKASNGAWRVKGYRGSTEVLLTVDGTGRVSME